MVIPLRLLSRFVIWEFPLTRNASVRVRVRVRLAVRCPSFGGGFEKIGPS